MEIRTGLKLVSVDYENNGKKAVMMFLDEERKQVRTVNFNLQVFKDNMYVDDPERPASAAAVLGDFVFLAGEPSAALIRFAAELEYPLDMCILMPQNKAWEQEIEAALTELGPEKLKKVTRYATRKSICSSANSFSHCKYT